MFSAGGINWITPDVLKFIAHKAEGLISEGKITELPAASAYATFIIPSRSKPTKPHIIVEYANGKWNAKTARDTLRPVCAFTLLRRH